MEKREELLAKMGVKGFEKKMGSGSTPNTANSNNKNNFNRAFPSNRYTPGN